ncbi:hypothetical protein [Haloglycomyces albus]|uniref:hypothetical protein n=1 Tax=Haloglycomyces albus TaxID=526067 RepID=UPI0012EB6995|nr:hypothetical protein [Haloglycomyces albus]
MSTGHGTDDATGQRLGSGRRATTVSRDSGGRFAGVNTSPPPGYRTRPLGHSQDRTAPYERESFYPEHRQVCWRGQLPTTGPVIARVGFLARTIELRRMTLMSAAIVAVEPGGAETLLGSIAWDAQYADHIDWSDNPARHSLIANGTMDMFWLDQRLRAAVERFFHNRHVPTRFIDPREEPVTHAG